jgi:hypothetical protein
MKVHNNRILEVLDLASAAVTAQVYAPHLSCSLYTLRIEKEYIANFFDNNELILT